MKARRPTKLRQPQKLSQAIYLTLAIAIVCIVLISVVLSMFNTFWLTRDRSISDARAKIRLIADGLNRIAAQATGTVYQLAQNEHVADYLTGFADEKTVHILAYLPLLVQDVRCIALVSGDGAIRYVTDGYTMNALAQTELMGVARKVAAIQKLPGDCAAMRGQDKLTLAAVQPVYAKDGTDCGVAMAFLDEAIFERGFADAGTFDKDGLLVLNEYGEVLYAPDLAHVLDMTGKPLDALFRDRAIYETGRYVGRGRLLFAQGETGVLNAFGIMNTQVILEYVTDSVLGYAFTAVLISTILLVLANTLIKSTTRPLAYLLQSVSDFRHGNTKVHFPASSIQEIDMLSMELNRMTGTIDQLLEDNSKKQKSLYEKELQILWAQFNPHLLYNSMNTIVDTAKQGAIQKVVDITMALSKYFQLTLTHGDDLILIRDELSHVENYLIIQKIRFEDLDYKFEVDDSIRGYMIPKLILQPIIENSIYHGIKGFVRDGMITVRAYMKTGLITFEIQDNGRGMRREELDGIMTVHDQQNITSGIGLNNISQRLRLYFGKEGRLTIESAFRKGTRVIICFPPNAAKKI